MKSKLESLKSSYSKGLLGKQEFISGALDIHKILFDYVDIIRTTDICEICVDEMGVSFRISDDNIWLYAPPLEARVAPIEIMNFDRYEPDETRVMDLLSSSAKSILDVGANIGWYSIRFAKRLHDANIYAFEPMPSSYSYLQRNVAKNSVGDRVHCYNFGLSEENGCFEFFVAPSSGTNASLLNVADAEDARRVTALTLTLDQWCANQNVRPDFVKCDVEGAELLVFRGGRQTLEECRPIVFAELLRKWAKPFGYHPTDMIEFFAERGYVCFAVGELGVRRLRAVDGETIETNYVFLHCEKHVDFIEMLNNL
ncbi:MAG: FkbM family methyltransferase [Halioglobus sp.]